MERKTMALTLVLLTALAAIFGGLAVTAYAAETETATTDTSTANTQSQAGELPFWGMAEMMTGDQGFGGGPGFGRGHGGPGGMSNIEVSSEYTDAINAILEADADVQKLISEGYNVTSIRPVIKTVVEADGTLSTKATTAIITLQNGTSGYATASVDISQAKVTQIVIFTRTVIDKTTS